MTRKMNTRRVVATLGFIMSLTIAVQAQLPVKVGILGGLNINEIKGSNVDFEPRNGYTIGAAFTIDIPVLPISIQPEIMYSTKGADFDGGSIRLDYIEVPVLLKYDIIPAGPVRPAILAGPYVGFNTFADIRGSFGAFTIENQVAETDLGGVVGLEVKVLKLFFGARYSAGINDVFTDDSGVTGKNGTVNIFAGLNF